MHHYFGTKEKLFLAAVEAPGDPEDLLPEVLAGGRENLGANAVGMLLRVWDGPARPAGLALIRSAVGSEWTAKLLREFLVARVIRRVVGSLGYSDEERDARGSLVASQMIGLVMARYVLRVEPLASAPAPAVVAAVGPTIQRYLTGEVHLPERGPRTL